MVIGLTGRVNLRNTIKLANGPADSVSV